MKNKTFQIGKTYQHSGGKILYICGTMYSKIYGLSLIGEGRDGHFMPVGRDEANFINWKEVSEDTKEIKSKEKLSGTNPQLKQ